MKLSNICLLQVMDRKRPPPAREPSPERSGQTLSPPPRKRNRPDSLSLSPAPLGEIKRAATPDKGSKPVEEIKRASRIGEEVTERRRQDEKRSDRDADRSRRESDRPGRSRDTERRSDRREYEQERFLDRRNRHYDDRRDRHYEDRRDRYRDDRRDRERRDRDRRDDRYNGRDRVARDDRRRDSDLHHKRSASPARPVRDPAPPSR